MSIASEIQQLQSNLSDSYTACQNKGATIPSDQNFDNLATCIGTITGGSSPVITSLSVTPTTSSQTITAPQGTDGYSPINVSAVTSSIDANITAGNIKDGVSILGVTGNYTGTTPTLTTKTITQNGTYNASSDNADGYSSVTVNVSGGSGSDPIGDIFKGDVDANGNYIMPYNLTWTGDVYFNGIKNIANYSSTSGGAFASYFYHQATQTQRLKCRKIIGKIYFPDLETVNHTYCFYSFCNGQTEITEVHFPKLYRTQGTNSWDYAFQGMGTGKLHLYFNSFTTQWASSNVSTMGRMLQSTTGATLHFPSNLQGMISGNFGGTSTVRLFDLPATS